MVDDCDKISKPKMSATQSLMLRLSIVLGMVAAVVTILYFTPMPDQNFKSCDRPCHALDWPMICRVKLNIAIYQTMSGICKGCPRNTSDCNNMYCASADGSSRGIITANHQLPGPSIQVCHNDILVIDVINKIPGRNLAVHWRGQPNKETPFMDGVPMVTQCPISSYTTFQYRVRASMPGTHFYHAHADSDRADGLFGALIVRQADKVEPHRKLYDIDSKDHVLMLSEWSDDLVTDFKRNADRPRAILINGKAPSETWSTLSIFKVSKDKRYRFRVVYASGTMSCPITLSIEQHLLKVISLDGNSIKPYEVSSVVLSKGERVDIVLKTNQVVHSYAIKVKSNCTGNEIEGLAMLEYKKYTTMSTGTAIGGLKREVEGIRQFDTAICERQLGKVCIGDVVSLNKVPQELREEVDRKLFFTFDYKMQNDEGIQPELFSKIYRINNLTFTYPSSPILTQPYDVPITSTCNELKLPAKCEKKNICECIHLEHIPLGSKVELILFNSVQDDQELILHLHGYHFYIVGSTKFASPITIDEIKMLDRENHLMKRNLGSPAMKDTIRIPKNGVVAVRFIADNPGFWFLRDEKSKGWTRGMDMIFQVGGYGDLTATPSSFPMCGSYVGPEFFLI